MDGWTYQTGMDPYQVPRNFVSAITLPDYLWFSSRPVRKKRPEDKRSLRREAVRLTQ